MAVKIIKFIHILFRDLFIVGGLVWLISCALEDIHPLFVSLWVDLRTFFFLVLLVGLISLLFSFGRREDFNH
ncbi:MAG: hypothetical protein AAB465_02770 [Patescibacteria group bacterium]